MSFSESNSPDIKPEIVFIPDLLKEMNAGRLRIPKFQRPFVWTPEKMLFLLDSIRNKYPIGSILFWDTDQKMRSSDEIGHKKVQAASEGIVSYALDGQQRLSTLFGVLWLKPDEEDPPWQWKVWYDMETKNFVHLKKKEPGLEHFPVWALLDTYDFFDAADKIRTHAPEKARAYFKDAQELAETFKSYKMPVIRIQNTTMDEAVRIFGRLNSSGAKIADDQMVSALAYRETEGEVVFDLATEIDTITELLAEYHFSHIDRVILLRVILAELELDVYRTNWEQMIRNYGHKLPDAVSRCLDTLSYTINFLDQVGVKCDSLLPYSMQLVVLSTFFRKCPNPSVEQKELLERWFWVSSYTGWFANGNSTSIRNAINDMTRIADGVTLKFESISLDEQANSFPSTYDFRSARVRVLVLFLLSLNPLDYDGKALKAWQLIAEHGYKALKHIFRASYVRKDLYRSPVNRTLLSTKKRTKLVDKLIAIPEDWRTPVLESHGISETAFQFLQEGKIDEFLEHRKSLLKEKELTFMKEKGVSLPVDEKDDLVLDTGEEMEPMLT